LEKKKKKKKSQIRRIVAKVSNLGRFYFYYISSSLLLLIDPSRFPTSLGSLCWEFGLSQPGSFLLLRKIRRKNGSERGDVAVLALVLHVLASHVECDLVANADRALKRSRGKG